jgi:hypothetical protein
MQWMIAAALASVTTFSATGAPARNRTPVSAAREGHVLLTATDRAVRGVGPQIDALLAAGMARSRTFAKLMSALDGSDVIVYVEHSTTLKMSLSGRLLFAVSVKDGPRYLRIQLSPEGTINLQLATLAHELQHALEIADHPEVRSEKTFAQLFNRIGMPRMLERCYDTEAARAIGRRVMLELQ